MGIMNIITNRSFFKKAVQQAISEIPPVFVDKSSTSFSVRKISSDVSFKDAFANLCFGIIWKRARVLANQNTTLYLSENKDEVANKNHWLYQLFDGKPNPLMNWRVLRQITQMWLDYYGNAYWLVPNMKFPNQVWLLPSSFVRPKIVNGLIKSYTVKYNSNSFDIDSNFVCHFKTLKPDSVIWNNNLYEGQPFLLQASTHAVGADKELIEYVQSYFLRDATSPFVLSSPNTIPDEQYERFRARWDSKLKDYPLKAVLEGGLTVAPLSGTTGQVNLGNISQVDNVILTRLGTIWGIAPALFTSNYNARATMEILKQEFYEDTIDPLLNDYEDTITDFFRKFDARIYFSHNKLSYTDPDTQFSKTMELYQAGILNRNEVRQIVGLPPIKDGDIYMYAGRPVETSISPEAPIKNASLSFEKKSIFNRKWDSIPEEFKVYFWKKFDRINTIHKKAIKISIVNAMLEIHSTINIDNVFYEKNIKDGISSDIVFDIDEWENILEKHTKDPVRKLVINVFRQSLSEINEDFDESRFINQVRSAVKNSTDKIKISANTIAEEIRTLIIDLINEDPMLSIPALKEKLTLGIGTRFNEIYTQSRADLIAQTTATYSTGYVQSTAWNEFGYNMAWLSMRDGLTREAHAEADGQLKGELVENGYLVDGLECEFPGDTGDPANDCNCRCSQFPIAPDEV